MSLPPSGERPYSLDPLSLVTQDLTGHNLPKLLERRFARMRPHAESLGRDLADRLPAAFMGLQARIPANLAELDDPSARAKLFATIQYQKKVCIAAIHYLVDHCLGLPSHATYLWRYRVALFEPAMGRLITDTSGKSKLALDSSDDGYGVGSEYELGFFPMYFLPFTSAFSLFLTDQRKLGFGLRNPVRPSVVLESYQKDETIMENNAPNRPSWSDETEEHKAKSIYTIPVTYTADHVEKVRFGTVCIDSPVLNTWSQLGVDQEPGRIRQALEPITKVLLATYAFEFSALCLLRQPEASERFRFTGGSTS